MLLKLTGLVNVEVNVHADFAVCDCFVGDFCKDVKLVIIVKLCTLEAGHCCALGEFKAHQVILVEVVPVNQAKRIL